MRLITISIVFVAFSLACSKPKSQTETPVQFKIPIVYDSSIPVSIKKELFNEEYMSGGGPIVAGKFNFQDTVDISRKNRTNELFSEMKMYDNSWSKNDSLDINGFDIIPDYQQTLYYIHTSDTSS